MGGSPRHPGHRGGPVPDRPRPGPDLTTGSSPDDGGLASPNIWRTPGTYEVENRACDPDGVIDAAMRAHASWRDRELLDVGCGSGYHLPRFAAEARAVTGVEPHPGLVALARRRVARLGDRVRVLRGGAASLPLADASVDVAHARWAYFFGPGCEPGLAELARVVRRGGTAFVVDNDPTRSTFGRWFQRSFPTVSPEAVAGFWSTQGWYREPLEIRWSFADRADLEAVVRIELTPAEADRALAEHEGLEIDYAVNLWWRRY